MLVMRHPATDREAFEQAQELLFQFEARVALDVLEVAGQRGRRADLDSIVTRMLAEFSAPPPPVAHIRHSFGSGCPGSSAADRVMRIHFGTREEGIVLAERRQHILRAFLSFISLAASDIRWQIVQRDTL
jgi:hypothetical protein